MSRFTSYLNAIDNVVRPHEFAAALRMDQKGTSNTSVNYKKITDSVKSLRKAKKLARREKA